MTAKPDRRFIWRRLDWRRPIEVKAATALLRLWAADPGQPRIVLEVRSTRDGVSYLLGAEVRSMGAISTSVTTTIPGTRVDDLGDDRLRVEFAGSLRLTSHLHQLRVDDPERLVSSLLAALDRVQGREQVTVQIILGSRVPARSRPAHNSSAPLHLLCGSERKPRATSPSERLKRAEPAFDAALRIGARGRDEARRRSLIAGVLGALKTVEAPDVRLRLVHERTHRLDLAQSPWRWPIRLNIHELTGLTVWPLGQTDLPGIDPVHPVLLRPTHGAADRPERVVAQTSTGQPIGLSARDSLRHTWLLGPNGTGKSTLLLNLICQDITAGRGVVLVEPKGDLIESVIARIPEHRRDDVVLLDPLDEAPVGLNPLAGADGAHVRVEGTIAVFRALFADSWGPRTQDILTAALSALVRRGDASLAMLPLILTNTGFRRSITQAAVRDDPLAAGSFWGWYEDMSDAERAAAIAPVMNKVRVFISNPHLRAVIGQRTPRFQVSDVLSQNKILLVPLRQGTLGASTAQLLGSLVVAELWHAILARPLNQIHRPVTVAIDEVQNYLHLPTDLGDALAQARGLGAAFTVANQFVQQLPHEIRAGFLNNIRSRVCFQLGAHDARIMAEGHPELSAEDLTSLKAFDVYASLVQNHHVTPYVSGTTLPAPSVFSDPETIRRNSRTRYGQPLDQIEQDLAQAVGMTDGTETRGGTSGRRRRSP